MPTFFRHRKPGCSTTSNVQGGHQNWTTDEADIAGEGGTNQQPKEPYKTKSNQSNRKETGGKPVRKLQTPRGMSLQTEIEEEKNTNKSPEKDDDAASSSSEAISPSPKRQNQKQTPTTVATRKSTRNQQTTLTTSLGNPIPINTIESASTTGRRPFEIDSPPD